MVPPSIVDPHLHPEPASGTTTVVFDDHRFCAGRRLEVAVMAAPHRHSQFEINHLLSGSLTYWFDGREIRLEAGATVMFWGMVPHRSVAHAPGTRFVVLYIPASIFISLHVGDRLRTALFRCDLVRAALPLETDDAMFLRWREDLILEDPQLEAIVRDELSARLRRIDRDGWRDLREDAGMSLRPAGTACAHADKVEAMARYIGEKSDEPISVGDVAASVDLHPNYAMTLFRRTVGLTMTEFVTRNRLDTAQALLVSTDDDVAAIAFASGFGSMSRFYEAFKARFDMSPAKFRRWHRSDRIR